MRDKLIVVRGGGDLATGTIHKLRSCGFPVLVLEAAAPSAIRRNAAFSEAVYEGSATVEGLTCTLTADVEEALALLDRVKPAAVVDAILAKRNLGTHRGMAPLTIALGPGFTAPGDVDVVVETQRGHDLGRLIRSGAAAPNTGVPGLIAGVGADRVLHAPSAGIFRNVKKITDTVRKGEVLARIETADGDSIPLPATIDGLLRGLLRDGYPVTKGFKVADIDPRLEEYKNCFTISDKARCIAGGVLEAVVWGLGREG